MGTATQVWRKPRDRCRTAWAGSNTAGSRRASRPRLSRKPAVQSRGVGRRSRAHCKFLRWRALPWLGQSGPRRMLSDRGPTAPHAATAQERPPQEPSRLQSMRGLELGPRARGQARGLDRPRRRPCRRRLRLGPPLKATAKRIATGDRAALAISGATASATTGPLASEQACPRRRETARTWTRIATRTATRMTPSPWWAQREERWRSSATRLTT
mmetsp:Transcript_40861/g.89406  ORF Transcript_40861/g.89406 Transcript_40861/m.89406 type:complete len:214 (+) Transcript_40861:742-1383(+)